MEFKSVDMDERLEAIYDGQRISILVVPVASVTGGELDRYRAVCYWEDKIVARGPVRENRIDAKTDVLRIHRNLRVIFTDGGFTWDRHGNLTDMTELNNAADAVLDLVEAKGFVNSREHLWQMLALLHTEVSEATQAYKCGEGDDRIAEELTDALIRLLHLFKVLKRDVDIDFIAKMRTNWKRPYRYNIGKEHEG